MSSQGCIWVYYGCSASITELQVTKLPKPRLLGQVLPSLEISQFLELFDSTEAGRLFPHLFALGCVHSRDGIAFRVFHFVLRIPYFAFWPFAQCECKSTLTRIGVPP